MSTSSEHVNEDSEGSEILQEEVLQDDKTPAVDDGGWPDDETSQLIQLVYDREILWKVTHPWYYRRDKRQAAIDDVAKELNLDGKYVETRITSLKTQYGKARRLEKSGSGALSARRMRTVKKQVELLGFMEQSKRQRSTNSNMPELDDFESSQTRRRKNSDTIDSNMPTTSKGVSSGPTHERTPRPKKHKGIGKSTERRNPIEINDSESEDEETTVCSQKNKEYTRRNFTTKGKLVEQQQQLWQVMAKSFQKDLDESPTKLYQQLDDVAVFTEHIGRQIRDIKSKGNRLIVQREIENVIHHYQVKFWQEITEAQMDPNEDDFLNPFNVDLDLAEVHNPRPTVGGKRPKKHLIQPQACSSKTVEPQELTTLQPVPLTPVTRKPDTVKPVPRKPDKVKTVPMKPDTVKTVPMKPDTVKTVPMKPDTVKQPSKKSHMSLRSKPPVKAKFQAPRSIGSPNSVIEVDFDKL